MMKANKPGNIVNLSFAIFADELISGGEKATYHSPHIAITVLPKYNKCTGT